MEQAIRALVDRKNNPHNPQSNNINSHIQVWMLAANFTETGKHKKKNFKSLRNKWVNRILGTRKANVAAVIKLRIGKWIAGSGFQIKKEAK